MEYKINDSLFCILQSTCIRNIAFPGYFLPTLGLNALAALTAPWQSSSGFLDCLQTMITLFQISLKPEQIGFNKTIYSHDSSQTRPIISLLFRFLKFFKLLLEKWKYEFLLISPTLKVLWRLCVLLSRICRQDIF